MFHSPVTKPHVVNTTNNTMVLLKVTVSVDATEYASDIQNNCVLIYASNEEDLMRLVIEACIYNEEEVGILNTLTMHGRPELWHWVKKVEHKWTPHIVDYFTSY